MTANSVEQLFPSCLEQVPEHHRVRAEDNTPVWMVDGRVYRFEGRTRAVVSRIPLTGDGDPSEVLLGREASLGENEAQRAAEAALRAWRGGWGEWPAASFEERIAAVERFASALEQRADRTANLLMWEIGKPLKSARGEVLRSVDYIRASIEELRSMAAGWSKSFTGMKGSTAHHARETRLPLGVVLCIAPFNYPVNELLTTVAPALLMGNVVIAKTPRFGVLANLVLADAFAECFPAGTVSLLPGDGREVIPPLMRATDERGKGAVDMLAFIGSEGAANAILGQHPSPTTLHKVLGLGSKNAAVVLPGADVDRAVAGIVKGSLGFNGQRCTAEKLVFVPRASGPDIARRIGEAVDDLALGMPWQDAAITPLPEADKLERMRAYVEDATSRGAAVVNAGGGDGWHSLMRPAVLYPVTPGARIFEEEQFGPVVPIAPYDDLAEVTRWQVESPFGQQAGVWGPDADCAAVVRELMPLVARVNVNDVCQRGPDSFGFTATDKSGFGILSLREALITFSRPVLVQSKSSATLDTVLPG